jgi:hypothetical protein
VRVLKLVGLVVVLSGALVSNAVATPITYIDTGRGSGTIGATSFFLTPFTIRAAGDTTARQPFSGGFFIPNISADITIDGLGDFTFVTPTRFFVNQVANGGVVGFARITGSDIFDGPSNAQFGTWDMLTSIGPINGTGQLNGPSLPIITSGGVLAFDISFTGFSFITFQATVGSVAAPVPEPGTLILFGSGLAGLVARFRRRRSTANISFQGASSLKVRM